MQSSPSSGLAGSPSRSKTSSSPDHGHDTPLRPLHFVAGRDRALRGAFPRHGGPNLLNHHHLRRHAVAPYHRGRGGHTRPIGSCGSRSDRPRRVNVTVTRRHDGQTQEVFEMISGAHAIIYSREAEADRAFLKDVLGLPFVDAGGGWLIFALPPTEVAVHLTRAAAATSSTCSALTLTQR